MNPPADLSSRLLDWYDRHRRRLPWRAEPGETPDPYRVWLSEIMLQQTTVATVGPYYADFLARWPTVEALAAAPLDDVLTAWAGLGYYARARNLHACAQAVAAAGGRFPNTEDGLRALPGIGPYTAAAIAAIAFDRKASPVDGNIERVVARLFAVTEPMPASKPRLRELAATLTPEARAGDHAQALMDLGATICTPRSPKCLLCPWQDACAAHADPAIDPADLPARAPKKARPLRLGQVFWLQRDGHVLLRRRPDKGLLGGMMEFPGSAWGMRITEPATGLVAAPAKARWRHVGEVAHGFTHFELRLTVYAATTKTAVDGHWQPVDALDAVALPTLMNKVARLVLGENER
ncbi:MAG: A/G-specific adenine glycosylase [Alphaproteobacteria bacterium]